MDPSLVGIVFSSLCENIFKSLTFRMLGISKLWTGIFPNWLVHGNEASAQLLRAVKKTRCAATR